MDVTSGTRFGRFTVTHTVRAVLATRVLCTCDCGVSKEVRFDHLVRGETRSCGCLVHEGRPPKYGKHTTKKDQTYKTWAEVKSRCMNPNRKLFKRYMGMLCERWMTFGPFLMDMGEHPGPGWSIDRIDNSRGYEPGNCRWATASEQARNKTNNRWLIHNGERRTLQEWSEITGFQHTTILRRLGLGWSVAQALTQPLRKKAA